jgi:hypothetical protein
MCRFSARWVGANLLAVPVAIWVAGSFFPSYDARPQYFAGSFRNIVEAGDDYLAALLLFLVVAGLLVTPALGLTKSPLRAEPSLWAVLGGLGVSAFGFAIAGVTGLAVWRWASEVADGTQSLSAMASRSESLASISQTMILLFGFGGLLVAMSVLGIVAVARRWTPLIVAVATAIATAAIAVIGAVTSGPVFWLSLGALPMLWAFAFGAVLLIRGRFGARTSP